MIKNRGIAFKLIFSILASSVLIFVAIFTYNYFFARKIILKKVEENAKLIAVETVGKIELVINSVANAPKNASYFIENSSYSKEGLINMLNNMVKANSDIYGAAIAFEPYGFDAEKLYFAPYSYKKDKEMEFMYIGGEDYQYFFWDWYQIPKELNRSEWSEPYYDEGAGNIIMATYSVPFYKTVDKQKEFAGIVTSDISLKWLTDIVASIKVFDTGYGFLLSKNGTFVTHPDKYLIMDETIFSMAETRGDPGLRKTGRDMIHGNSGFIPFMDLISNRAGFMFYMPLDTNGWSLGMFFPADEMMADIRNMNNTIILGISGIMMLFVVTILISRAITKPLSALSIAAEEVATGNFNVLLPKVKSLDEVGRLTGSFDYMQKSLKEYIKRLTETTAAKEKIDSELKIARDIQMSIVPKIFPAFPERGEFDIFAIIEPAREVGGDLYDFFFIDNDNFCFVIGDVSDKGVPASLFMAVTKTLIKATSQSGLTPENIISKVNNELSTNNDSCMFVTIFLGILNVRTGETNYVNAGHNLPLVIRQEREVSFLKGTGGVVVGAMEEVLYKKDTIILTPGDSIFMYTDGVTEAMNEQKELFSDKRLLDEVSCLQNCSTKDKVSVILKKVKAFSNGTPQSDDITMMVLQYKGV